MLSIRLFSFNLNSPIKDACWWLKSKVFAAETKSSNNENKNLAFTHSWSDHNHWPGCKFCRLFDVGEIDARAVASFLLGCKNLFRNSYPALLDTQEQILGFILILFTANISISFVYYSCLSWTGVSGLISNSSLILVVIAWGGISKVERPWK